MSSKTIKEKNMDTMITHCSEHDSRLSVTLFKGDTVLQVAGYDELPHRMAADGRNYDRISWKEFHRLLTTPNEKAEVAK